MSYVPTYEITLPGGVKLDLNPSLLSTQGAASQLALQLGGTVKSMLPDGATVAKSDPSIGDWLGIQLPGVDQPINAATYLAEETPYGFWTKDASGLPVWNKKDPPAPPPQPPAPNPPNVFPGFPGSEPSTMPTIFTLNAKLDAIMQTFGVPQPKL